MKLASLLLVDGSRYAPCHIMTLLVGGIASFCEKLNGHISVACGPNIQAFERKIPTLVESVLAEDVRVHCVLGCSAVSEDSKACVGSYWGLSGR